MPTAYKGKLRIACRAEICIQDPVRADATENCFACREAVCEILGLDDQVRLAIGVLDAGPETEAMKPAPKAAPEKGKKKR